MKKDLGLTLMKEVQLRYTLQMSLNYLYDFKQIISFPHFRTIPILLDTKDALVESQPGSGNMLSYGVLESTQENESTAQSFGRLNICRDLV